MQSKIYFQLFFSNYLITTEMLMTPTSLKESAARTVKINAIPYTDEDLPRTMIDYLSSANCCVNPECKGKFSHLFLLHLSSAVFGQMTITNEKKRSFDE